VDTDGSCKSQPLSDKTLARTRAAGSKLTTAVTNRNSRRSPASAARIKREHQLPGHRSGAAQPRLGRLGGFATVEPFELVHRWARKTITYPRPEKITPLGRPPQPMAFLRTTCPLRGGGNHLRSKLTNPADGTVTLKHGWLVHLQRPPLVSLVPIPFTYGRRAGCSLLQRGYCQHQSCSLAYLRRDGPDNGTKLFSPTVQQAIDAASFRRDG